MNTAHGFVWPEGLPNCSMCGRQAADMVHVTPGPGALSAPQTAAYAPIENKGDLPLQAHNYVLPGKVIPTNIPCVACGHGITDSRHPIGMPSGSVQRAMALVEEVPREEAFVAEIGDRLVIAGRGRTGIDLLTGGMADLLRQKSSGDSPHLWISGRYVEADAPNRNAAYWSTEDLQIGEPTVAHGPINWLHEERHIIGAIAASEMVASDREAAADGVGNHIVALGAVWPWVYPAEARMIRDASQNQSLWFSMECVSRNVACQTEDCGREMAYADYMRQKETRCEHMKGGQPRRFVDPIFEGAGIIVPPVRPGWAKADARVLMPQAAKLAERQAAAFEGMETSVAESVVAQLIASVDAT